VTGKSRLICPGEEARDAVELANAIVLSSNERRELELPLDRSGYAAFIEKKINLATASK
jgi:hypothetical protein